MINMVIVQLYAALQVMQAPECVYGAFARIGVKVERKAELSVNIAGCADACINGGIIY
ncbi:MAG: hypothetical protein K2O16_13770 [Lachnospiraceae bacterium]|nr:hypothetical protein [Lachnospiraceae bacterium]MDE7333274.1 hypothetical protein [Lachnospiraceae bacterium]